ncbi:MAG: sulfotransferase domain-containing protein [Alphaproteobacteria bacterium]|nr:sulfotransferase domain-containing protein [Alphaproteobacteria bacterium SS10]
MGILWLASYPKSGNTWTRAFLANLFMNQPQPVAINKLTNFAYAEYRLEFYEQVTRKKRDQLTDEELNQARPAVQQLIAASSPNTIFVKTHSAMGFTNDVPTIEPSATEGGIYIVRNPLDVCVSYAHHVGVDYDQAISAMGSSDNQLSTTDTLAFNVLGSWSDHVKSWADAEGMNRVVLRYEDMHRQPAKAFGKLVKFLQLPKNQDRLERAIRFSSFKELSGQESQSGFIEKSKKADKFFRQGKMGGWRDELSDAQAAKLIEDHREVMERFDYLNASGEPRF